MDDFDGPTFDRDIARAARAERTWLRLLRTDAEQAAADAWYEPLRHVTTRTTFVRISELADGDPMRDPFRRWVHRLALTRIAGPHLVAVARARQKASLELDAPERGTFSPREIVHRVIADAQVPRVRVWLSALGEGSGPVLVAEKEARDAVLEIGSRLGVPDAHSLAPYDDEALRAEAERFLAVTRDLASSTFGAHEDLAGLLPVLVAREVPGVWPRKPDARWLTDLFGATPLLAGLSLDLGPTPASIGAASFVRSLARFGAAYARSSVQGGVPFVFASDASDAHPMRRGALFAWLALDSIFLRKKLGLSREAADKVARAIGVTTLARLRLDACGVLVDFARARPSDLDEVLGNALQVRVPSGVAGVLPRPDVRAAAHFFGALFAVGDRESLRDGFDEDWFQNPQGLSFLREQDATLRSPRVAAEETKGRAEILGRALEAIAG